MVMVTGRNPTLYSEDAQGLMHQIRYRTAALVSFCVCIHSYTGKYFLGKAYFWATALSLKLTQHKQPLAQQCSS